MHTPQKFSYLIYVSTYIPCIPFNKHLSGKVILVSLPLNLILPSRSSAPVLIRFAIDIATGMEYLSAREFVHRVSMQPCQCQRTVSF